MSVIPLTIFCSLLLAGTFVVLFAREQRRRHLSSPERDSLLPLADEFSRATPAGTAPGARDCGCRRGARSPCTRCLQRLDELDPAHF